MSINVYLKGDEVTKLKDFKTKQMQNRDRQWEEYGLPGVSIWREKGRWYITLNEPTEPIPAAVAGIVEEISFRVWIPGSPSREAGIYRHESAEAEVGTDKSSGDLKYEIRIRAKNMADLLELYRKIRIGSIRPAQSYEGEQGGSSRAELVAAIRDLEQRRYEAACKLAALKVALRDFCWGTLESAGWPFCSKKTVSVKIREIITQDSKDNSV